MRFCLFIFATLLLYHAWNQILAEPPKRNWGPYPKESHLIATYQNADFAELARAYATGTKRRLPRKMKELHQNLGLLHLLTPSGLHLSTVWLWMSPLLLCLKRINRFAPEMTSLAMTLGSWTLEGIYSLQRMALFRFLNLILQHFKILQYLKVRSEATFILTFFLAWVFGNYTASPLSFALSFLFLGTILSHRYSLIKFVCGLLAAQALVQSTFAQPFFFFGALYGMGVTFLFAFFFPLFLLDYWVWSRISFLPGDFEWGVQIFYKICSMGELLTLGDLAIDPSFCLIFFFLLFPLVMHSKKWELPLALLLLFHSEPAMNLPRTGHRDSFKARPYAYRPGQVKNIKRTRRGYKTWDKSWKCYHHLLNWNIETNCYKKD